MTKKNLSHDYLKNTNPFAFEVNDEIDDYKKLINKAKLKATQKMQPEYIPIDICGINLERERLTEKARIKGINTLVEKGVQLLKNKLKSETICINNNLSIEKFSFEQLSFMQKLEIMREHIDDNQILNLLIKIKAMLLFKRQKELQQSIYDNIKDFLPHEKLRSAYLNCNIDEEKDREILKSIEKTEKYYREKQIKKRKNYIQEKILEIYKRNKEKIINSCEKRNILYKRCNEIHSMMKDEFYKNYQNSCRDKISDLKGTDKYDHMVQIKKMERINYVMRKMDSFISDFLHKQNKLRSQILLNAQFGNNYEKMHKNENYKLNEIVHKQENEHQNKKIKKYETSRIEDRESIKTEDHKTVKTEDRETIKNENHEFIKTEYHEIIKIEDHEVVVFDRNVLERGYFRDYLIYIFNLQRNISLLLDLKANSSELLLIVELILHFINISKIPILVLADNERLAKIESILKYIDLESHVYLGTKHIRNLLNSTIILTNPTIATSDKNIQNISFGLIISYTPIFMPANSKILISNQKNFHTLTFLTTIFRTPKTLEEFINPYTLELSTEEQNMVNNKIKEVLKLLTVKVQYEIGNNNEIEQIENNNEIEQIENNNEIEQIENNNEIEQIENNNNILKNGIRSKEKNNIEKNNDYPESILPQHLFRNIFLINRLTFIQIYLLKQTSRIPTNGLEMLKEEIYFHPLVNSTIRKIFKNLNSRFNLSAFSGIFNTIYNILKSLKYKKILFIINEHRYIELIKEFLNEININNELKISENKNDIYDENNNDVNSDNKNDINDENNNDVNSDNKNDIDDENKNDLNSDNKNDINDENSNINCHISNIHELSGLENFDLVINLTNEFIFNLGRLNINFISVLNERLQNSEYPPTDEIEILCFENYEDLLIKTKDEFTKLFETDFDNLDFTTDFLNIRCLFAKKSEELETKIELFLKNICNKRSSGRYRINLFRYLPDPEEYPDYYEIIENPISIDCIKNKEYLNYDEFIDDLKLMFNNALIYNDEFSQVYKDAIYYLEFIDANY
ncbi:Chromatin structure-remodeling complex subunit rsc1 [Dictyocoela muelleri]|nr:Chromatin structure-remodeling complex subunit rsc1 [Dictyocoela muelleri]